jgi:hypothetical protein
MSATGTVSCDTTATSILTPLDYQGARFKNLGPANVWVGPSSSITADQSSTSGYPLAPGESVEIAARTSNDTGSETWYGITDEGTADVAYIVH